jgi:hypothetical protein
LPALRAAKAEGLPISVETCPHYLCLDAESIPDGATQFKCAPPIRDRENRDKLWGALLDGSIDFVITDHSPCTHQLKQFERGHFQDARGGIASLQLGQRLAYGDGGEAHLACGLFDRRGVEAVVDRAPLGLGLEIGGPPEHQRHFVAAQPVGMPLAHAPHHRRSPPDRGPRAWSR